MLSRKKYPYQGNMYTKQELQLMYNRGQLRAMMYDTTQTEGVLEILNIEKVYAIVNYNGSIRVNQLSQLNEGFRFKLDGNWKNIRDFAPYKITTLKEDK